MKKLFQIFCFLLFVALASAQTVTVPPYFGVQTISYKNCGTATDADGNVYQTIIIGDQCWLRSNLRYLPSVVGPATESTTEPYYYVYNYYGTNVEEAKANTNFSTYGVLYNWPGAITACPAGWHLPNDVEWIKLADYLGGLSIAGGKLKEAGISHWQSPNVEATNETGFCAHPGGIRSIGGYFSDLHVFCKCWSNTDVNSFGTYSWVMNYNNGSLSTEYNTKSRGFSVRCVKD